MADDATGVERFPDALPLRPDDLLAFRLGRLVLLLDTVPGLPSAKPFDIERISFYDFFADNPFLIFGRDTPEHETLVIAGFDSRNLSYQSSAQRFSSGASGCSTTWQPSLHTSWLSLPPRRAVSSTR